MGYIPIMSARRTTTGTFRYSPTLRGDSTTRRDGGSTVWWLILDCDPELGRLMRHFYRQSRCNTISPQPPLWGTHVSVIRGTAGQASLGAIRGRRGGDRLRTGGAGNEQLPVGSGMVPHGLSNPRTTRPALSSGPALAPDVRQSEEVVFMVAGTLRVPSANQRAAHGVCLLHYTPSAFRFSAMNGRWCGMWLAIAATTCSSV
jgi:hypothetical protein